jgi:hypothetical protein
MRSTLSKMSKDATAEDFLSSPRHPKRKRRRGKKSVACAFEFGVGEQT